MNFKMSVFILITAVLSFMIWGCGGEVPQQEIDAAKAAVESAQNAGADQYVPDKFNEAKRKLDNALAEVEKQKDAMFGSFDDAKNMLAEVQTLAKEAEDAVPGRKEEVKKEAEDLLAQIPDAVKETKKMMYKAPRGKEGMAALKMIKSELKQAEESIAEVNTAMENGEYMQARNKAQAILDKIKSLQSELQ
jgi:DNA repair exonuclease SbcCD ATPase subunit